MKNFYRWLREVYRWLRQVPVTRHYWWAGAVVLVAVGVVWGFDWSEGAFRIAGTVLQLLGVLTVVWGILKTRTEFKQTKVRDLFAGWLKRFPPLHPPKVTVSGHIVLPGLVGEGYGHCTHGPSPDQTLEGRLTYLEGVVKNLSSAQGRTYIAVLQAEKKAQKALDAAAQQFAEQVEGVARKIEATATGGIHVSAVGVILLFVGTVCGGLAPELHSMLAP